MTDEIIKENDGSAEQIEADDILAEAFPDVPRQILLHVERPLLHELQVGDMVFVRRAVEHGLLPENRSFGPTHFPVVLLLPFDERSHGRL